MSEGAARGRAVGIGSPGQEAATARLLPAPSISPPARTEPLMTAEGNGKSPFVLGYDASSTVGPRTGIGVVASELLTALLEELPDPWEVRVLVNSAPHPLPDDPWVASPRVRIKHTKFPGRLLLRGWQYLHAPSIESFLGPLAVHHSPASYIQPTVRAKRVLSVYDLYFLEQPEPKEPYGGGYFEQTFPRGLKRVHRIITTSEYTRRELSRVYGLDDRRITVTPAGVNVDFYRPEADAGDRPVLAPWVGAEPDAAAGATADGFGAPDRGYFLCVASMGPRKNLMGLLEAYAAARAEEPGMPPLVLVGDKGTGPHRKDFEDALERLGLEPHVRRPGYVPREHLPAFYRGALALVVPSHCEGFGLPVLEAMACGCPVVTSRSGSLPEVAGEAALYVTVETHRPLTEAMLRVAREADLRARLRDEGLERAKEFSWRAAARRTIEVYRAAMEGP